MRGFSILFRSQLFIRLTSLIVLSAFVQFGLMQIQMFYLNVRAKVRVKLVQPSELTL